MAPKVAVGDKRSNGGVNFSVVKVTRALIYVKRSDGSKKELTTAEGAHAVTPDEFASWAD